MTQRWSDVSFLHWRVPSSRLSPHLPPGVRPDEFDGTSWVGLICFRMSRFAFFGGPSIPYLGRFPEINVRLLTVDDRGRRGVYFLSLEASRLAAVAAARIGFGLPYRWARMRIDGERVADVRRYRSTRLEPHGRGAGADILVRPTGVPPAEPALADFLTARWGMHSARRRSIVWRPNVHEPWPLESAELVSYENSLFAPVLGSELGLDEREPDVVLFSPGVNARFGAGAR